ncbi:MAG: endonuclease III [Clostridiales bacterium]|nr:endonuclease III [Clostridiales bacterium]
MKNSEIIESLNKLFPNPKCELDYNSEYQLLVAVILSAQCTDKRVNIVTRELFKDYGSPEKMMLLSQQELEKKIHSCGFYRNKAKNILSMTKDLIEKFDGRVPNNLDEMQSLAGVGRKTANVVLAEAFKDDAIAVDTHVLRVSNRLGLVKSDNPNVCEKALMNTFDKSHWSKLHLQLVHFGRYICKAQRPECETCPFKTICQKIN